MTTSSEAPTSRFAAKRSRATSLAATQFSESRRTRQPSGCAPMFSTIQHPNQEVENMRANPCRLGANVLCLTLLLLLLGTPGLAFGADNTATGDIAGQGADLTDSNVFSINSTTLALVKAAFLTDGTQLASGVSVPKGTNVRFLVYVDNTTTIPVADVNAADVLDALFAYQAGTIKVDNSVATGATAAAIYASVNATGALGDAVDGSDVAGISGTTVSAGSGAGNQQLDIAASSVWAMLFEVEVQ